MKRSKTMLLASLSLVVLLSTVLCLRFLLNIISRPEAVLKDPGGGDINILYLHHSTGRNIWEGGVEEGIRDHDRNLNIIEQSFPKRDPYGWNNYPYDYWNIWVNNAGNKAYMREPTLEMITEKYDLVIFKHCFPVANIEEDTGDGDVSSSVKSLENYKLQYEALKVKMHEFPNTKFILWTGPALVRNNTEPEKAERMKEFVNWVKNDWDEKGDNIFLWDFYSLETGGSLYLKDEYAVSSTNSHPNKEFSAEVAPLLCKRIIDVIEGRGDETSLTGE